MRNGPRLYETVFAPINKYLSPCIKVSQRYNAVYVTDDFHRVYLHAAAYDTQAAGCAISARNHAPAGSRRHTDEWIRYIASKTDKGEVYECFRNLVISQIEELRNMNMVSSGEKLDIAIDMHLIARHNKKYGAELTRSKYKNGTYVFERHITAQCIVAGKRLILSAMHMPALEKTVDFVRKTLDFVSSIVEVETVMFDREFWSAEVISYLNESETKYIMPCRNSTSIVDAIREFAAGMRGNVSDAVITGTDHEASYTLAITERKKRRKRKNDAKLLPEERFIGFATNIKDIDPDQYSRRWGIETGYRMVENARVKTHSKNPTVRLLCFMYSTAMFNVWVMANATQAFLTKQTAEDLLIGQQEMKDMLVIYIVYGMWQTVPPP